MTEKFKALGCERAQLTVAPVNLLAIGFYKKSGWKELGPHPSYPGILMGKRF